MDNSGWSTWSAKRLLDFDVSFLAFIYFFVRTTLIYLLPGNLNKVFLKFRFGGFFCATGIFFVAHSEVWAIDGLLLPAALAIADLSSAIDNFLRSTPIKSSREVRFVSDAGGAVHWHSLVSTIAKMCENSRQRLGRSIHRVGKYLMWQ